MGNFMRYILRPFIDARSNNSEAYQRSLEPLTVSFIGVGGQTVGANIRATSPATIAVGPTHKKVDGFVTGNTNDSLTVQTLTEPDNRSI